MANTTDPPGPALRITGAYAAATCPTCKGRRRVPCPPTFGVRGSNDRGGMKQVGSGHPIPCPECMGTGIAAVYVDQAAAEGTQAKA